MTKEYVVNKVTGERCEVLLRKPGKAHMYLLDANGRPRMVPVDLFRPAEETASTPPASAPAPDVTVGILTDRGKKYGDYKDQAQTAQELKSTLAGVLVARKVHVAGDVAESLHMICTKLSRLVHGDPEHLDSWDDIAGYARLVADRLRGVTR